MDGLENRLIETACAINKKGIREKTEAIETSNLSEKRELR